MLKCELKKRSKFISSALILLLLSIVGFLIGYFELKEMLLNRSDVFVLTRGIIISLTSPIIIAPIFVMTGYALITNKEAPLTVQKRLAALFLLFLLVGLIAEIAFSIYYTNKLDTEGFQRCRGIPIGSLPGQSVKYAKSEELCKQKRKY